MRDDGPRPSYFRKISRLPSSLGMRGRLMCALIPTVVVFILAAGLGNYGVADHYINLALERSVRLQNLAAAHEVERFMEEVRRDLLFAAKEDLTEQSMRDFLERKARSGGRRYLEFTYLSPHGRDHISLLSHKGKIALLDPEQFDMITPNPLLLLGERAGMKKGEVWASPVLDVEYPLCSSEKTNAMLRVQAIRFVTPHRMPGDGEDGLLLLSAPATDLRDILTLFNSEESPLWAYPRSSEPRYDFMIDKGGWMLFQSAIPSSGETGLSTGLARSGRKGTLSRPWLKNAFLPDRSHGRYWGMVAEINQGNSGLYHLRDESPGSTVGDYYFAFAPVRFNQGGEAGRVLYGGIVRVDRSVLPIVAGYRYLDVMVMVTFAAIVLITLLIFWLSRKLTSPIRRLSDRLNSLPQVGDLGEIAIPYGGKDIEDLKESINTLIRRILSQMEEIREKDRTILNVNMQEPADLANEQELLDEARLSILPDIIGVGPRITELKNDVLKASQVDVDVLVTGETGTGKQLVAEAIHAHGARKHGPFISINCGALDENLLLDALFGHVKGAFTEAKTDRKGAFVEASSGTLFLDEIQSASPKVQQSLLRALAIRKIKPLGSDHELEIDVRIIAATNVDLPDMIDEGTFREDLYYRLKVVSIETPALRDQPENIPLLALHYLHQAEQLAGGSHLTLSKGALRKLSDYSWPGNIRELINNITRAAVMAETDIIQGDEIRLETDAATRPVANAPAVAKRSSPVPERPQTKARELPGTDALNPRQRLAWETMQGRREISRTEYQEIVGGDLSPRTANYDLSVFVKKGFVLKTGRGPATRYVVNAQTGNGVEKEPPE